MTAYISWQSLSQEIEIENFFASSQSFMPHGHCYLWQPSLLWLHASSDALIFISYMVVSSLLAFMVLRLKAIPFLPVVILFGTFIFVCGMTHLLEVYNIWIPAYWLSGVVKLATAIASVGTAVVLPIYFPAIQTAVKGAALAEALELLKSSEDDIKNLAETIPQIVWTAKPDGNLDYYNQKWFDYTGMNFEQTKDWGWGPILHPEDLQNCIECWSKAVKTGEPYEVEYRFKRAVDGEYRWHLGRALPVRDSRGIIIKWFGTCTDIHLQKQAVEAARLAEQKLAQFLNAIPTILWATDANGVVTLSEGKGLAGLGLKPGEAVSWDMINGQGALASTTVNVKRALSGESFSAVTEYGDRVLENQYSPITDTGGKPVGMIAISNDITEKMKLEISLAESQQNARDLALRLKAVLENAPVALHEINSDWIYTFSEGRILANLGMRSGELVGTSCLGRHKSNPERMKDLQSGFAGQTINSEFQMGGRWIISLTTPFLIRDGIVKSILSLAIDITNQKLAEKSTQMSESRFKKVYEAKMFGMLFWDKAGAITDANAAFLTMLGFTRDDLVNGLLCLKDLTPTEYSELDAKALTETITQGYCEPYEKQLIRKDGSRIDIIISGATVEGEANAGGIALVLDVSAKKRAEIEKAESILNERAALHASKTKSQFLANMSHEIRTPINGVVGMLNLLLDTPLKVEQRDYLDSARTSAESLLTVINDILDFSKIEAGKLEFENSDFDLFKVLHNIERSFQYQTQAKGLKFVFDCPQTIPRFYNGDSGRLRQILNNLLSNAIKFTSKGQIILRVRHQLASQQLRFEIEDTGIGIPTGALQRMFKAFSQADASTSRRFGGTGLGLSIAKHLVERMGGEIGVETQANVGSTFWFTALLPAAQMPVRDLPETPGTFDKGSLQPFRILLAEDNIINQKIALRYLEKMGLRADAVANGLEVIDALRQIPYDLILMDCQMPEMDGFETTRIIRASQSLERPTIPIVAMTANAIKGDRERCIDAGMNDYLSKPVAQPELFAALMKWLKHPPTVEQTDHPQSDAPTTTILDRAVIEELRLLDDSADGTLISELATQYFNFVPSSLIKMQNAADRGELKIVAGEAHQLKSSSGNLGLSKMALVSSQLEEAAIAENSANVSGCLRDLDNVYRVTELALRELLEEFR